MQRRLAGWARYRRLDANHPNWRRGGIAQHANMHRYPHPPFSIQHNPRRVPNLQREPPEAQGGQVGAAEVAEWQPLPGVDLEVAMPLLPLPPPLYPLDPWGGNPSPRSQEDHSERRQVLQADKMSRKTEPLIAQADAPLGRVARSVGAAGAPRAAAAAPRPPRFSDHAPVAAGMVGPRERVEKARAKMGSRRSVNLDSSKELEDLLMQDDFLLPDGFPHRSRWPRGRGQGSAANLDEVREDQVEKRGGFVVGDKPRWKGDVQVSRAHPDDPFRHQVFGIRRSHALRSKVGPPSPRPKREVVWPSDDEPDSQGRDRSELNRREESRRLFGPWGLNAGKSWGVEGPDSEGLGHGDGLPDHRRRFHALLSASGHLAAEGAHRPGDPHHRGGPPGESALNPDSDAHFLPDGGSRKNKNPANPNPPAQDASHGDGFDQLQELREGGTDEEAKPWIDVLPWPLRAVGDEGCGEEKVGEKTEKVKKAPATAGAMHGDVFVMPEEARSQPGSNGGVPAPVHKRARMEEALMTSAPSSQAAAKLGGWDDPVNQLGKNGGNQFEEGKVGGSWDPGDVPKSSVSVNVIDDLKEAHPARDNPDRFDPQGTGVAVASSPAQFPKWPVMGVRAVPAYVKQGPPMDLAARTKVGAGQSSDKPAELYERKVNSFGAPSPRHAQGKVDIPVEGMIGLRFKPYAPEFPRQLNGAARAEASIVESPPSVPAASVSGKSPDPIRNGDAINGERKESPARAPPSSLSTEERKQMVNRALKKYSFYQVCSP